ncbi:hypothetical protein BLNAU_8523 [Blattamonas nauphoetae]|uniref:Uncharacterized protein n=1 Tax=Blattamonas nauphoetae TaxID=2049346 RepID=A0ABQ9XYD2_9EUKA|nr:hypothetical protein BLNAU_8523 [Blattamonas nauphoetae]
MYFFSILLTFVLVDSTPPFSSQRQSSLNEFISSISTNQSVQHSDSNPVINVPEGLYQAHKLEIASLTLLLQGNDTVLIADENHIVQPAHTNNANTQTDHQSQHPHMMFTMLNSTVHLSLFWLDCHREGWIVASLVSSNVHVHSCTILSNGLTSPFWVSGGMGDGDNSMVFVECSHQSPSNPALLPLVSCPRPSDQRYANSPNHPSLDEKHESSGSLTVSGTLLTFDSKDVILGTGPLLDLSLPPTPSRVDLTPFEGRIVTTLTHSSLRNTTSSRSLSSPQSSPQRLSQRLLSSSLDICADYLSGTAIMDFNRGGNLVCHNTSFTRSKQTEPTHSYQHYTQQQEPEETSLYFFLCTFKDILSEGRGGALKSQASHADFKLSHCSFQNVSTSYVGGGVAIYPNIQSGSFTLLDSCFDGCSSEYEDGGCLYVMNKNIITISQTIFHNSQSCTSGGALSLEDRQGTASSEISNCLISLCSQLAKQEPYFLLGGGGLYIVNAATIKIEFVQFQDCSTANQGSDIAFAEMTQSQVTASTLINCVSTSDKPRYYFLNYTTSGNYLLPDQTVTASLQKVVVEEDGEDITLTATLSQSITGQLLLLVDNAGTTLDPSSPAPTISRVLSFTSSSRTPTLTASIGEKGILQLPLEGYTVVAASAPKATINVPSGLSLTPITRGRIVSVDNVDVSPDKSRARITLGGIGLSSQPFTVVVERSGVDVTSPNNIEFISPTSITVDFLIGLTESSSTLQFGQKYTVKAVTDGADSFIVKPSITIPLSDPPTITSISASRSPDCISVQFSFTGSNLPLSGVFTITLDTSHSFPVTYDSAGGLSPWLDITLPDSLPLAQTLSISSITPNDRLVLSVTSITTPTKPNIISADASLSEESPDFVVLVVKGSNFPQKVWTLTTTAASGSLVIPIEFTTPTEGTATIEAYNKTNTLQYGSTYHIDTLTLGPITVTDPNADGKFTTPNPPSRIESISTTLNADKTKAIVCFGGVGLEGGQWDVETDPPHQIHPSSGLVSRTISFWLI